MRVSIAHLQDILLLLMLTRAPELEALDTGEYVIADRAPHRGLTYDPRIYAHRRSAMGAFTPGCCHGRYRLWFPPQ